MSCLAKRLSPFLLLLCTLGVIVRSAALHGQVLDPFDPFDIPQLLDPSQNDEEKSPDELVLEAAFLMEDKRLLDARTKLLKALRKDPAHLRAHLMLGGYYLVHVGHFRLALRYVTRAQEIFVEQNGPPPYTDTILKSEHSQILYLLSQINLDLDKYEEALKLLDEYSSWGYYATWYPASRAWILMKLGKLDEAIRVARLGLLAGADFGRTVNILGILLSMNGNSKEALDIFRQAIEYEFSQGIQGQPATPLNNSGEVYKEAFLEEKAEGSWLRATSLPDGCEHVLPSLNLALLYIEQLNLSGATQAMNNFESCVAQYPLRNGEEHRALVKLARGRIALLSGHIGTALDALNDALARRQWFGKIGTNQEDLEAAILVSLAQANRAMANLLDQRATSGPLETLQHMLQSAKARLAAWWYRRRARQVLMGRLNDFEDLEIRNTDSLLEYPTLGELLRDIPSSHLSQRIGDMLVRDKRPEAAVVYRSYLAENLMAGGDRAKGIELFGNVMASLRPRFDDLLRVHLLLTRLEMLSPTSAEYQTIAGDIFSYARPELRSHGHRLPVVVEDPSGELTSVLARSPFQPIDSSEADFIIKLQKTDDSWRMEFSSLRKNFATVRLQGTDLVEMVNKLSDEVFQLPLI